MKKIAIALIAVVCAFMCFALTACADPAGKIFVFDTIKVSDDAEGLETVEALYKDKKISFDEEKNTCSYLGTTYYYAKKGSTVYLYLTSEDAEELNKENAIIKFKLSGKTITIEEEFRGKKMIMTFKLQTEEETEE